MAVRIKVDRYSLNEWSDANAGDMLKLLGVKTLPPEGMPERYVPSNPGPICTGVRVYVKPLAGEKPLRGKRHAHRVYAICDCGQHVPVGRLHQHKCKT